MIRVLIADSYPIIRCGLKQILSPANHIHVVGEAATYAEILHKVRATGCQLLLLGGVLLDESGLELLADLQRLHPSLRILVFSIQTNNELGVRTVKAGASGYLTLNSTMAELVKAVPVVANGRKYICSEMAESLAMGINNSQNEPPHRSLSDREFQVMRLIGAGNTLTETAQSLGLGKTTISTYRRRVLEKLNLRSSAEIVRYAVEHRLACCVCMG